MDHEGDGILPTGDPGIDCGPDPCCETLPVADDGAFCFEQPLNERIRTFLRLEHLLARLRYHEADESVWGRRAAMGALLDILNVMSRHDIRTEVSKELGQRYAGLERLAERDDVDEEALRHVLDELDTLGRELQRVPPQFASYLLRDNELLNSLNNRLPIPGGSCGFDLPAYQHWLAQDAAGIRADIERWCERILPFENAVRTLLRLLRDSARPRPVTAENGVFVHNTETGTQLIRAEAVVIATGHAAHAKLTESAYDPNTLPPGFGPGLDFEHEYTLPQSPVSFGAHAVVVEVDQETFGVKILRYVGVHDCGQIINPMIVEGQIHGGIAQGLGQALFEQVTYDQDGQPLSGTLMDYAIPRAVDIPDLILDTVDTVSPTNPLGAKGIGSVSTVPSPVAIANAIMDAIASTGVRHIDTPYTKEKLWRSVRDLNPSSGQASQ